MNHRRHRLMVEAKIFSLFAALSSNDVEVDSDVEKIHQRKMSGHKYEIPLRIKLAK